MGIVSALKNLPGMRAAADKLATRRRHHAFKGSEAYWENRYRQGGSSGAGSYGQLARFKAEVLNDFVARENIRTVLELGCGDGAQLTLAEYPSYVGVDVAPASVEMCRALHLDENKTFHLLGDFDRERRFDLSLSLDVVYHLVEDSIFEDHMRLLFSTAERFVIIYSSDFDGPHGEPHVRHRSVTKWAHEHAIGWRLRERVPNRFAAAVGSESEETSFADFYIFEKLSL